MVVVVHQPHFTPWLGYLHRMTQADVFVLLDHVQFERGNYQNRTRFRMADEARWLTVPLVQHSINERIVDKEVDNRLEKRPWGPAHFATLRQAYRESGFFNLYGQDMKQILERRWERLIDLDLAMLDLLRDAFSIRTPIVRSSGLGVDGQKSDLVLNICRAVGATTFLGGFGGSREYLDRQAFADAGIGVEYHEFTHPQYKQCGQAPFIAGLTSFDLLFNCGPRSRGILLGETDAHAAYAAA
jgi:hypothetical protein